jgi:hypothetical protein
VLKHPDFPDMALHSDAELADVLGVEIVGRSTIHEWPLSCVQKLELRDGSSYAYKSQLPPTVEPAFYENASSPLLPGHRLLETVGDCQIMLIDWVDAPALHDVLDGADDVFTRGQEIVAAIGDITGELPRYLDVGTADAWISEVEIALAKTSTLIRQGRFPSLDAEIVDRVRAWATDPEVVDRLTRDARIVNSDLRTDQVLVTADGYRVLDWQRPVIANPDLDLVSLLLSESVNPRIFVHADADRMYWMLRLHWTAVAQHDLFPGFTGPFFDQWADEAVRKILT